MQTRISDLIDVIHSTIIKNEGNNDVILHELQAIDNALQSGNLQNYIVDVPFFRSIIQAEAKKL